MGSAATGFPTGCLVAASPLEFLNNVANLGCLDVAMNGQRE